MDLQNIAPSKESPAESATVVPSCMDGSGCHRASLTERAEKAERKLAEARKGRDEATVVVPREPTPEMVEIICRELTSAQWPEAFDATAQRYRRIGARNAYRAMLATAQGEGK